MKSKTRIIVLHMKEIIYTAIFVVLGILLIALLAAMFLPDNNHSASDNTPKYKPGVYTSTLDLNNTTLELEVTVDETHINAIRFSNLNESVATMYPLVQPAIEDLAEQIYKTQSLENLQYSEDTPYTSQVIIETIQTAIEKATVD